MKYLFFVQSEGRGHLTQALTLAEKLRHEGHEVCAVIMNDNPVRKLPPFFKEEIDCPLIFLSSPYFLPNRKGNGIRFFRSIAWNTGRIPLFLKSLKAIRRAIEKYQPDVLINFYEALSGMYLMFYKEKRPAFSIGHQFFIEHAAFKAPKKHFWDRLSMVFYNHFVSFGSKRIALSFTEEDDQKNMAVCPPLIRKEIIESSPSDGGFILSYLLNYGYYKEIEAWSKDNPSHMIEAFWDKTADDFRISESLVFHPISGQLFLDKIEKCSIYASTGGFDSICEAAYLQKDILMVPTRHHFEQLCNAADAERAGLATSDRFFNIDKLLEWQKKRPAEAKRIFKLWVDNNSDKIISAISALSQKES